MQSGFIFITALSAALYYHATLFIHIHAVVPSSTRRERDLPRLRINRNILRECCARAIPTRRFFFSCSILSRFLSRSMQFHFSLFSGSDGAIPSRSNEQFPANSVTFNDLIRHVSRTVWSNFFYRCKRRQTIFQLRITIGNWRNTRCQRFF